MKETEMQVDDKTCDTWGIQTLDCAKNFLELPRFWF